MPNLNRHLMRIYNTDIAYIADLLQDHHQYLGVEEFVSVSATSTTSGPIASDPAAMTPLPPMQPCQILLKSHEICSQHYHLT